MDEFSSNYSYNASKSKNKEDIDEISFVTAREDFTMNRTALLTADETFTSVKSNFSYLSEDEQDLSSHDVTLLEDSPQETSTSPNLLAAPASNAMGERSINIHQEFQTPMEQKNAAQPPKKSKLKIPKRYFRPLNSKAKSRNLMHIDLSKMHLLRGAIQKPKKYFGLSTKIPLPTIFLKHSYRLDQRN